LKKLFMSLLIINFAILFVVPRCEAVNEESPAFSNGSFFAVQTGLYLSQKDADNQIISLKSMGLDSYIFQSINSNNQTVYAVRIGKYKSYKSAANRSANLKKILQKPTMITYYDSLNPAEPEDITAEPEKNITEPEEISDSSPMPALETPAQKPADLIDVKPSETSAFQTNNTDQYPETAALTEEPSSLKSLQKKMKELEAEIQKLRDASDVRSQLAITEEEAKAEEEDILEAAGREYTLTQEGTLRVSYGISYSYSGYDAIRESTRVEDVADHTISNSFSASYGLKDNLTAGVSIPFVYKYHKVGTVDSLDTTDFGDLHLSWRFQPVKSGTDLPTIILNGSFGIPVGRNPYEIQVGEELSTSSGIYKANFGASISQVSDPVVAFGSLSISYPFATQSINQKRDEGTLDEVDPGMSLGASIGLGYALSYKLNINLGFSYSYSFETTYKYKDAPDATSGTSTGASLSIGTGYKLSRDQNLNFSIGIPITSTRSFSLSLSTPIDFAL